LGKGLIQVRLGPDEPGKLLPPRQALLGKVNLCHGAQGKEQHGGYQAHKGRGGSWLPGLFASAGFWGTHGNRSFEVF
jgi:hypothetical protein